MSTPHRAVLSWLERHGIPSEAARGDLAVSLSGDDPGYCAWAAAGHARYAMELWARGDYAVLGQQLCWIAYFVQILGEQVSGDIPTAQEARSRLENAAGLRIDGPGWILSTDSPRRPE